MNPHFERGQLLFEQQRFEQARESLLLCLAKIPEHWNSHLLLVFVYLQLNQTKEAQEHAEKTIQLQPHMAMSHHALARVYFHKDKNANALSSISQAIEIDPEDEHHYGLQATVLLAQKEWEKALEVAEQGLALNARYVECQNIRAHALNQLGRTQEAGATIFESLSQNPHDSNTHANMGWTYLQRGDSQKALEHFREALRIDPNNLWARHGIVESLKAKHWTYSLFLRFILLMSRLKRKHQLAIIIGAVVLIQLIGALGDLNPALGPFTDLFLQLYLIFVFGMWLADPMFNLLLFFNRDGRLALSKHQKITSIALALCLVWGTASCIYEPQLLEIQIIGFLTPFLICFPVMVCCDAKMTWPRLSMVLFTTVALACFILTLFTQLPLLDIYLILCVLSTWIGNFIPRSTKLEQYKE